MSNSYPFLAASRVLGVPYGVVLSFADALEKHIQRKAGDLICWEREAMDKLTEEQRKKIREIYAAERERRFNVASKKEED